MIFGKQQLDVAMVLEATEGLSPQPHIGIYMPAQDEQTSW